MKSIKSTAIILCSLFFLGLTACGGGSNRQGTHTHDDGSVHDDHTTEEVAKPTPQESFKVAADSTTTTTDPAHGHDHGHDHGDGKPHTH